MKEEILQAVVDELTTILPGRSLGKIFQVSKLALALDFRTLGGRYLLIDLDPSDPRLYLISRKLKELEKQSLQLQSFSFSLKKQVGGAVLSSITRDHSERIVRFNFETRDSVGNVIPRTVVAQLTGKSANLLILDERGYILDTLRAPRGEGQQIGDRYLPPPVPPGLERSEPLDSMVATGLRDKDSISETLDQHYQAEAARRSFESQVAAKQQKLKTELARDVKLKKNLQSDLVGHGHADEHKRIGDLLLANIATAERRGNLVALIDYFQETAPTIEIPLDESSSLQEEAARRFTRYTKAKRAATEIAARLQTIDSEIARLKNEIAALDVIASSRDHVSLGEFGDKTPKTSLAKGRKPPERVPGVRAYRSTDGFEILVGRSSADNDRLTFRVARPNDTWLHAANYPGSHVVVRNHVRAELPQRTIIEAAQLAGFFSQAKSDSKVDVHYTQRKYLSKPKGAPPGMVRLSIVKTITVEPKESVKRIQE
jgi:predicted ribosome quality control (RQC) complex YloA/Tae2 family protein